MQGLDKDIWGLGFRVQGLKGGYKGCIRLYRDIYLQVHGP